MTGQGHQPGLRARRLVPDGRKPAGRWLPLVAVAAIYVVSLAVLPLDGVWINDIGSRIIQTKSILASGYSDFSISWPGRDIDPSYDFVPIAHPFATIRSDRLFSVWSPFFPTVASVFFRLLGYPGLYLLPLAGSLALLAALARLTAQAGGDRRAQVLAVLVAGLCTPVWFYSLTFWEHTLVMALLVWAATFLLRFLQSGARSHLVATAALAAFAAYFRVEVYAFCFALLVVILLFARHRRIETAIVFTATCAAAMVPLWLFHWKTLGSPWGHHLATIAGSSLASHLLKRPAIFYRLFVGSSQATWVSFLVASPLLVLLVLNRRLSGPWFGRALPLLALGGLAVAGVVYSCFLLTDRPIACLGASNSLFPAAPVLILGLVRLRESRPGEVIPPGPPVASAASGERSRTVLWALVLVYAAAYWLAVPWKASWGIHWGARYLLVLYPLLAVPCALNISAWQRLVSEPGRPATRAPALGRLAILAIVAASLGAQVLSINILQRKMDFSSRLNREVASRPEQIVLTDQWWVGHELYAQFDKKPIFLVRTNRDYDQLAARLSARGYREVLFVAPTVPGAEPEPGTVQVSDNGLNYWNVDLVPVQLRPGARR